MPLDVFASLSELVSAKHPEITHEVEATQEFVIDSRLSTDRAVKVGCELLTISLGRTEPRAQTHEEADSNYGRALFQQYLLPWIAEVKLFKDS